MPWNFMHNNLAMAAVLFAAIHFPCSLSAQTTLPGNSIGADFTTMRYLQHNQYVGAGFDYRYLHHGWIGFQAEATEFPQSQLTESVASGYKIGTFNGAVLCGHRWGRAALYGEAGYGYLQVGVITENGSSGKGTRTLPDFIVGGLLEVALSHRLSLTYEVRDNRAYSAAVPLFNGESNAVTLNGVEARMGVAFHFNLGKRRAGK